MSRKPYVRQMSKTSWFLTHSRYKHYILHEVTCIFIAIYAVILIFGLFRLGQGPEAWQGWLDGLRSPLGVIFQILAFGFAMIHTWSWFKVVPQAMRIQRGESFVPGNLIIGAHYGVLAIISLFVLILAGVA